MRERPRDPLEDARLCRAKRQRSLARGLLLSVVHSGRLTRNARDARIQANAAARYPVPPTNEAERRASAYHAREPEHKSVRKTRSTSLSCLQERTTSGAASVCWGTVVRST